MILVINYYKLNMKNLKKQLKAIKKSTDNKLMKYIINDILSYHSSDDDIQVYIKDVLNYGCKSGIATGLIYYNDTHRFAKKYINEIMEILDEIKEETEEEFNNYDGDRLNTLAWLGYEETVRKIAEKLEIEY